MAVRDGLRVVRRALVKQGEPGGTDMWIVTARTRRLEDGQGGGRMDREDGGWTGRMEEGLGRMEMM